MYNGKNLLIIYTIMSELGFEWKITDVDIDDLSSQLDQLGSQKEGIKDITTVLLQEKQDWSQKLIWLLKHQPVKQFQIRQEWDTIVVEDKETIDSWNNIELYEVELSQSDWLDELIDTFNNIGYQVISKSVKQSIVYVLDKGLNVKILFDTYSDINGISIPPLMQINAERQEQILQTVKIFGYTDADLKDWWPEELVQHYWK